MNKINSIDLIRGNNAIANKQYDLALQYYLNDLDKNPKRASTLFNIASTYAHASTRSLTNAQIYFQKLINHPEVNTYISKEMINNLDKLGMTDELIILTEKISAEIHLARILYFLESDEAYKHMQLVPNEERDKHYYHLFAQISFSLKDYSQTIKHITTSTNMGNLSSKLFYLKSQALLRMKQFAALKKTNGIYQTMLSLEKNKDPSQQLEVFQLLLENNTELYNIKEYQYQLLVLLLLNHQKNESIKLLSELDTLIINTNDRENILSAAINSKNISIVDELFSTLNQDEMSASEATLYCISHQYISYKNKVREFCKQSVILFPESAALHFWVGILWLNENKTEKAIEEILISINYAPWMDDWRIQLAQIYLSLGQINNAKKITNDAINTQSNKLQLFKLQNGLNND